MRRNRETIRNPSNWKDQEDTVSNPWLGFTNESYRNEHDEGNEASEMTEDITEKERENYYTVLEQIAEREKLALEEEQYYKDYEEWFEDSEYRSLKRIETFDIPREIIERYPVLSDLPQGVCVMGGVARSVAREIITGDREPIRDIDLVNIVDNNGESLVDHTTLDFLARKYMADDYAFGHGINNEKFDEYFKTRDFTINQCLIREGKLFITNQAYNDFQENIIRPTEYELPNDGEGLSSRLFMKALMMKTVIGKISDSIPLLEDVDIDIERVYPFDIALTLNKMMSRGAEAAMAFTEELVEWGIIPEEYKDKPIHTASMLLNYVYSFEFRPIDPEATDDLDDSRDDSRYLSHDVLGRFHPRNTEIRNIIEEYYGLAPSDFLDFEESGYYYDNERIRGNYTLQDYQRMNGY